MLPLCSWMYTFRISYKNEGICIGLIFKAYIPSIALHPIYQAIALHLHMLSEVGMMPPLALDISCSISSFGICATQLQSLTSKIYFLSYFW